MNGVEGTPDKDPRATPVSSHTTHQNPGRVQQLVRKPTQHTGGRHIQSQTRPGFQQSYGNNLRSTPKQLSGTSAAVTRSAYSSDAANQQKNATSTTATHTQPAAKPPATTSHHSANTTTPAKPKPTGNSPETPTEATPGPAPSATPTKPEHRHDDGALTGQTSPGMSLPYFNTFTSAS